MPLRSSTALSTSVKLPGGGRTARGCVGTGQVLGAVINAGAEWVAQAIPYYDYLLVDTEWRDAGGGILHPAALAKRGRLILILCSTASTQRRGSTEKAATRSATGLCWGQGG
ncbi:MAG: hypothetical protein IPK39_11765 [Sulfuritalea sp.]|nr:hypothetical protein [Sulfuritalea sp.]